MEMNGEQIKAYLEQRLKNIKHNLDDPNLTKERWCVYYAQEVELEDILRVIR